MSFEVLFNRPTKPMPMHRLHGDMAMARTRLVLASAWFTDRQIAQVFVDSPAREKLAILSKGDLARDRNTGAVQILRESGLPVAIIGTTDWREGTMHHKFVVADDVVWVGSYNFTVQAQKNYENILRAEDRALADTFWAESLVIAQQQPVVGLRTLQHQVQALATTRYSDLRTKCDQCPRMLRDSEITWVGYGTTGDWPCCEACAENYMVCGTCGETKAERRGEWITIVGCACTWEPAELCLICEIPLTANTGRVDIGSASGPFIVCSECNSPA